MSPATLFCEARREIHVSRVRRVLRAATGSNKLCAHPKVIAVRFLEIGIHRGIGRDGCRTPWWHREARVVYESVRLRGERRWPVEQVGLHDGRGGRRVVEHLAARRCDGKVHLGS